MTFNVEITQELAKKAVEALTPIAKNGMTKISQCHDCSLIFHWAYQTKDGNCPECNSPNWDTMDCLLKLSD